MLYEATLSWHSPSPLIRQKDDGICPFQSVNTYGDGGVRARNYTIIVLNHNIVTKNYIIINYNWCYLWSANYEYDWLLVRFFAPNTFRSNEKFVTIWSFKRNKNYVYECFCQLFSGVSHKNWLSSVNINKTIKVWFANKYVHIVDGCECCDPFLLIVVQWSLPIDRSILSLNIVFILCT